MQADWASSKQWGKWGYFFPKGLWHEIDVTIELAVNQEEMSQGNLSGGGEAFNEDTQQ